MMKFNKKSIILNTDRLYLRLFKIKDISKEYIEGLNDPQVNRFLINVRLQKQTKKTVADFILHNLKSPSDILLGVFLKKENTLIGTVRIGNVSYLHYLCTVGICFFNKKYWGKGYALESINEVVKFIFAKLGMHYIEAGVYAKNKSSINLFSRAGFFVQSVCKNKYRHDDKFKEVLMFGKINSRFDYSLLK